MATSTSLRRGMSDQTRFLLDKVTARRILEGLLKLAEGRDLTTAEVVALDLYEYAGSHELRQFMVPSTESVLRRLGDRPRYTAIIHLFRQHVEVAFPTRYFKRWAPLVQIRMPGYWACMLWSRLTNRWSPSGACSVRLSRRILLPCSKTSQCHIARLTYPKSYALRMSTEG
jgi:hypothetical protein